MSPPGDNRLVSFGSPTAAGPTLSRATLSWLRLGSQHGPYHLGGSACYSHHLIAAPGRAKECRAEQRFPLLSLLPPPLRLLIHNKLLDRSADKLNENNGPRVSFLTPSPLLLPHLILYKTLPINYSFLSGTILAKVHSSIC